MLRTANLLIAIVVLEIPLIAYGKTPEQADDLQYCAKLSHLYDRYVGRSEWSSAVGTTPDVDGGVAVAECREGNAKAAIPTLERLLRDAGFTLPPRR
jgi:hypothetical protein